MNNSNSPQADDLHDIVDQKLTALMREMMDADWRAEDVALAMSDVIKRRWLDRAASLRATREAMPKNFISDGNEG